MTVRLNILLAGLTLNQNAYLTETRKKKIYFYVKIVFTNSNMQTTSHPHHDNYWLGLDALGPGGIAEGVGGLGEVGAGRGDAGDLGR